MDLKNKTAFITGGASGLGLATAKNFIAAGANVMLYDLRADALEAAAASLGPAVAWHAGDVADEVGVSEAIAIAKEKLGTINVNVNAAGIGGAARTVGKDGPMPLAKFEHIVRVNLVGTFNVLRLCAEVMQVNERERQLADDVVQPRAQPAAGHDRRRDGGRVEVQELARAGAQVSA